MRWIVLILLCHSNDLVQKFELAFKHDIEIQINKTIKRLVRVEIPGVTKAFTNAPLWRFIFMYIF